MASHSVWIVGNSRSGKTNRLVEHFCRWLQIENHNLGLFYTKKAGKKSDNSISKPFVLKQTEPGVLVLAANDDNRRELSDKIVTKTLGKYPIRAKTPLGFFQDEVILFWPLLIELLHLKAQFPVRLRPETEQELATKLWREQIDAEILRRAGVNEYRLVRRILDLLQLAAYSGTACEGIAEVLQSGLEENGINLEPEFLASLLLDWRNWCLERGLLTYGIITELYTQHLLSDRHYQERLSQRYQAILADDVDDYPAVTRQLFETLLQQGAVGAFTYNPDGAVRLGLGADPNYLEGLARHCRLETLFTPVAPSLADNLARPMVEFITQPMVMLELPATVQSIQTTSRAELLRTTAEVIGKAIKSGRIQPEEIAIIAPGLDAIARYTITEILTKQNIPVESLNDQRPLISSPTIRALLTMLALVYPGLGRLVDRDAVAEMLVVLSRRQGAEGRGQGERGERGEGGDKGEILTQHSALSEKLRAGVPPVEQTSVTPHSILSTHIDPVRAGLIADYCFVPHPDRPNLLPVNSFERWDRIGYAATTAYTQILQWIEKQRSQQEQRLIPSPISLLYLAIQDFLCKDSNPPYDQMAALRELLETAQHYWEIDTRLRQEVGGLGGQGSNLSTFSTPTQHSALSTQHSALHTQHSASTTLAEFIQLLRRGTITANPYPLRPIGLSRKAVTLATIFQYRSSRRSHRWHFWLDAGSPLWAKGGAATLFGAPLFLRDRLGEPWTAEDEKTTEQERLRRILTDLLSRVSEKVYLCHSDLAVNGQEQLGPLLPLVHTCVSVISKVA
ncbi:recombinase family protein [Nostoc spongiaeforme FACHB-130]|uniref:Recombinase family protein n=1 Tax=Nostoc spongiaeforme FACHB-130 TaxID=1357510 RepID=A0ABR8FYV6_9NOSO|nr:recombinase family protein [Nostoc spongiaeforme]MBD2596402.1 recombinase family protein [Nostoc spongiaeforme FACHB-130]